VHRGPGSGTIFTSTMLPQLIIPAFDRYLAAQGLRFEAVVIGGAALALLGVVQRPTDDCDVLDPTIPEPVLGAARSFAATQGISPTWLNSQAHDFVGVPGCLPEGWRARLRLAFQGTALVLHTLGRLDLLCTKLVALVDRGTDYADCLALRPTQAELEAAWPFVADYEGNAESRQVYWLPLARKQLARLGKELGYDVVL
jgi:Nucleotidyltransferase of unknown function (DUF6036)